MGNVVRKNFDFKTCDLYVYEEKLFHLSERRIISVHILRKNLNEKLNSDSKSFKYIDKTIFFIHGVAGCSFIWWQQIEFFVNLNYTVISIDLLGHGSSYRSKIFNDYQFHKLANDCLSIFDYFYSKSGLNILIGHSYGCSIATFIAHDRQNLISRLVLISGGSSKPLGDPDDLFSVASCCLWCLHPVILSVFRNRAFNSSTDNGTDKFLSVKIDSWVLKATIIGQVWDEGDTEYHKQVSTPTLLIHGEEDEMVMIDDEWDMLQTLPKCHLKTIPGVGHMSMLKAPSEVNSAILFHITKDWESVSMTTKPQISSTPMSNQTTKQIFRSFSLYNYSKRNLFNNSSSACKECQEDYFADFQVANRKTLPSSILIGRRSTRLSTRRANSKRHSHLKNGNNDTVVEEISIS